MMFDVDENDQGCVEQLLEGTVLKARPVEDDEGTFILTYSDGREVVLIIEAFGLVMRDVGSC